VREGDMETIEAVKIVRDILEGPDTSDPAYIRMRILESPRWAEHAILALWKKQTEDEKRAFITKKMNGVGFNKVDAGFFTYCANWLNRGNHLSGTFLQKAQRRLCKYSHQLSLIARGEV
jgi:hypothetical protein